MNSYKQQCAFTLIELLITLIIISILVTTGVPNLQHFVQNNRLTSYTNTLIATFNFARGEAITVNRAVNITAITAHNWAQGWTIWIDNNDNSLLNVDEIIREVKFNGTITINGPTNLAKISLADVHDLERTLSYRGNGTLAVNLAIKNHLIFTVCDDRSAVKGRQITLSRTGHVNLKNDKFPCS